MENRDAQFARLVDRVDQLEHVVSRIDRGLAYLIQNFRGGAEKRDSVGGAAFRDPGEGDRRYDFRHIPPRNPDY